jgi:catechol 2,3-dioxygenase-like lactoylglutathione lyase family enzyme
MPRGIDHLVLAARDLDAQAALYRDLGFLVGARNRHSWGTLNHIVQFSGCFLELLTTEPDFVKPPASEPVHNFAGFLADYLARREGMAMLVLESKDAKADHDAFQAKGIGLPGPFFFERRGKRPDGSDIHVAFTLSFAAAKGVSDAGFFVCQQHFPENFWNAAFQAHPNGVTGIAAVTLLHETPQRLAEFASAFTGEPARSAIGGGEATGSFAIQTGRGVVEVVNAPVAAALYSKTAIGDGDAGSRFAGVHFRCRDLDVVRKQLTAKQVPHAEHERMVVVPASAAFGVALTFV